MKTSRITNVSLNTADGDAVLRDFLFGGRFGPSRVPRHVDPAQVLAYLLKSITIDSEILAWAKAWEVAQFYELPDFAHYMRQLMETNPAVQGIGRPVYAASIAADLGGDDDAKWAAEFFDRIIVPRATADAFPLCLQTLPVLAPFGSPDKLAAKINAEVKARALTKDKGEAEMRAFQTLADIQKLQLPGARLVISEKSKLAPMPPPDRRPELVQIYLKLHPITGDYIETWTGRMLRKEAMDIDAIPVGNEITAALAKPIAKKTPPPSPFLLTRGVQAIIYLQVDPDPKQLAMANKAPDPAQNFLWDDPHLIRVWSPAFRPSLRAPQPAPVPHPVSSFEFRVFNAPLPSQTSL